MRDFMDEDFLLHDESSRRLWHDWAEGLPIVDYHSHLPPSDIAHNARFSDIAQAWLGADHYKWRAMRANGVPEADITGHAADRRTFDAWAATLPQLVGNPLYHWTHLELNRYFGLDLALSPATASAVWEACNAAIAGPGFGARDLLVRMKVAAVCTTDDPADGLEYHASYAAERAAGGNADGNADGNANGNANGNADFDGTAGWPVMAPAFRPDRAFAVEDHTAWKAYLARLGDAAGVEIRSFGDLVEALDRRHGFFHTRGCRISDHAFAEFPGGPSPAAMAHEAFDRAFSGEVLFPAEAAVLKAVLLLAVARMDAKRGWAMQLHLGAVRNLNSRLFAALGPDVGCDAVGGQVQARPLAAFLDALDSEGSLPKVILYSLNPNDYEVLASVMGCFQGGMPGKLQLGAAWWFNDSLDGMERQIRALANFGLLGRFVGMLTDSRSFLSFPRHEYFRRLLCGIVGGWVERGEAPADFEALGGLVRGICCANACEYFRLPGLASI